MIDQLKDFVCANVLDHLRGRWASDIETQLNFTDPAKNTRVGAKSDGSRFIDLSDLQALGPTGWNFVDQKSVYVVFDLDNIIGHVAGVDSQTLDMLVTALVTLPEVEVIHSKSGNGYHVVVYFNLDRLPRAEARKDHIENAKRALKWLASRLELTIDLEECVDACGVVAWIWHRDRGEHGFKIIKRSTASLPEDWETEFPANECDLPDFPALPLTPKHQAIIDALTGRGLGEWKDERLQTHTAHLAAIADDSAFKIAPGFATTATGKGGPSDRNCWMLPAENGSWRVYRHGRGTKEHDSWWTSAGGWSTCYFNRRPEKIAPTKLIVAIGEKCDLFHDSDGRAYAVATIVSIRETIPVNDSRFRAYLRIAYRQQTGCIASIKEVATAVAELEAVALQQRPEHPVAIRVAEHAGKLYIDLADRERRIVEVAPVGWRIVSTCPVRFIHPAGMLPLPTPLLGGTLADLKRFINIDPDDLALLLAFIVACFHPRGPYALLLLIGEQGSAKTSLMRLIADFIDPNIATGGRFPKDERDVLVAAQLRRLLSFDNVDELNRKLSSLLCCLATGAALASRKLFSDAEQAILRAKRPIVLTSIHSIVTASDLLDRTIQIVLPPIPPEQRKSEFAIEQDLRRDGVRGRILGYILAGVVAALKGHAAIQRADMPRMADVFSWATAAESGFGIPPGSAIDAMTRQADEESTHVVTDQFGRKITELCERAWKGTATELAETLALGLSAREAGDQLREIAPDLRRRGFHIEQGVKSNGSLLIKLNRIEAKA